MPVRAKCASSAGSGSARGCRCRRARGCGPRRTGSGKRSSTGWGRTCPDGAASMPSPARARSAWKPRPAERWRCCWWKATRPSPINCGVPAKSWAPLRRVVQRGDGVAVLRQRAPGSAHLVLLDPPFDGGLFDAALAAAAPALAEDGFIYLEAPQPWNDAALAPLGLAIHRHLRAGGGACPPDPQDLAPPRAAGRHAMVHGPDAPFRARAALGAGAPQ